MFNWFKKKFSDMGNGDDIDDYPSVHHIPNLGPNREVTIHCIVRASSHTYSNNPRVNQNTDGVVTGISPACVGAMLVEVDEYGLRFVWKPREPGDDTFLSPFGRPPFNKVRTKPAADSPE